MARAHPLWPSWTNCFWKWWPKRQPSFYHLFAYFWALTVFSWCNAYCRRPRHIHKPWWKKIKQKKKHSSNRSTRHHGRQSYRRQLNGSHTLLRVWTWSARQPACSAPWQRFVIFLCFWNIVNRTSRAPSRYGCCCCGWSCCCYCCALKSKTDFCSPVSSREMIGRTWNLKLFPIELGR